MDIDPGQLKRWVSFERRDQAPGAFGQPIDSWALIVAVWASIKPLGGKEQLAAMAVQAQLSHTILVRYRPELMQPVAAAQWRIVYAGRHFAILGVREVNDGRHWIIFDCQEGGADGH
ncbi:MAG: phage head closure protein [Hydrogenophaga sp.]|uniref:phage head closure protein n=1 Tax=Hydrogenophaga sp. TaxID=1904254 RepID=UPI004035EB24